MFSLLFYFTIYYFPFSSFTFLRCVVGSNASDLDGYEALFIVVLLASLALFILKATHQSCQEHDAPTQCCVMWPVLLPVTQSCSLTPLFPLWFFYFFFCLHLTDKKKEKKKKICAFRFLMPRTTLSTLCLCEDSLQWGFAVSVSPKPEA